MTAYLKINDLHKSFYPHGKTLKVLDGIDLEVEKGEIFGIIGFSGAGKSTLARCINRLETSDSGSIELGGTDILKGRNLGRICLSAPQIFFLKRC